MVSLRRVTGQGLKLESIADFCNKAVRRTFWWVGCNYIVNVCTYGTVHESREELSRNV